jgi:hypothetical protein
MNILWIGAIIGIIIGIIIAIDICVGFWEHFGMAFAIGILGTVLGMIICVVGGVRLQATYEAGDMETVKSTDEPISLIALCDNMGTDGTFYLGSGTIDSEMKYVYAYEDEELGMITKTKSASDCYIKNIPNDEKPYAVKWREIPKENFWSWLFVKPKPIEKITFYVPSTAVYAGYNIDFE